tara:strand:- start:215 stop:406 length:192 start_codon:yes stop_codon:yes gene_type:complete
MGNILLIIVMLATLIVLVVGIVSMARGGDANRKYGNKLMTMRVALQAAALALLGVLFLLSDKA